MKIFILLIIILTQAYQLRSDTIMQTASYSINTQTTTNIIKTEIHTLKRIKSLLIITISLICSTILVRMIKKHIYRRAETKKNYIKGEIHESNRISKEIHDNITSSINFLVSQIPNNEHKDFLKNTNKKIQKLSHRLNIEYIEKNKFTDVLNDFLPSKEELKNTDLSIVINDNFQIEDHQIQLNFLRISHSLINYGLTSRIKAKNIILQFSKTNNTYTLEYTDNGIRENSEKKKHYTLNDIREIAHSLSGSIHISKNKENGLYLKIKV